MCSGTHSLARRARRFGLSSHHPIWLPTKALMISKARSHSFTSLWFWLLLLVFLVGFDKNNEASPASVEAAAWTSRVVLRHAVVQSRPVLRCRCHLRCPRALYHGGNDDKIFESHRTALDSTTAGACNSTSSTCLFKDGPEMDTTQSNVSTTMTEQLTATDDPDKDNDDDDVSNALGGPFSLYLMAQFLLFIGVGAVIPSIPLYGKELGLSSAVNGIVISAPAVAMLLLAKVAGSYADQARKPAMMVGMAVIAVADGGTAMANGLVVLLLARLGLGAGRCLAEAGERGWLADLALQRPAVRGRALSIQQVVTGLGIALGAPFGGVLVEHYSPRAAFLCVSVAAVMALILYAFLPETTVGPTSAGTPGTTTSSSSSPGPLSERGVVTTTPGGGIRDQLDWSDVWAERRWRGLALCQSGATFGFACKIASIPILASDILPGGAIGAGALLSAAGLSGIVSAPLGGWMTDHMGAKTTVLWSGIVSALSLLLIPVALRYTADTATTITTTTTTVSSVSSFTPFTVFGPQPDDFWHLLPALPHGPAFAFSLLVIAWSMGAAAQSPALTALAQEWAPPGSVATAMALPRAAGDGTYIVAPFLLGIVADYGLSLSSASLSLPPVQGLECALAGSAILVGVVALATLSKE